MSRSNRHQSPLDDGVPSSNDSSESSLLEKGSSSGLSSARSPLPRMLITINVMGFLISILMFSMGLHWQNNRDAECFKLQSWYSPALSEIDLKYRPVLFNGSLDYPSIYRGDPSLEVDAAWDDLTDVNVRSIPEEDVISLGKSTDAVKIPSQFGGGYMASVEVNHQLHCVNFLRKSLFRAYYSPPSPHTSIEFTDTSSIIRVHQGHCIEMLRQFVMCHADAGLITYHFVKGYPQPYPDFNTWHQCRNFESVLQWTKVKQITADNGGPPKGWNYVPGDGDVVFDMPP